MSLCLLYGICVLFVRVHVCVTFVCIKAPARRVREVSGCRRNVIRLGRTMKVYRQSGEKEGERVKE